jgi:osmotically-inducible protein OsmY
MSQEPRPHRSCIPSRTGRASRVRLGLVVAIAVAVHVRGETATGAGIGPGDAAAFTATAYCDRGITKSGVPARQGVAAADPDVLPVGSVIRVSLGQSGHQGIYTVMDTGGKIVGRRIDLYIGNCDEARLFGLRRAVVRVLRLGWNPGASAPPLDAVRTGANGLHDAAFVEAVARDAAADDLSDGAITAKVKSRLALDDSIRSRDIHVATKDAVVTLSGQVASDAERDKAVRLARETEGVKSVVDRLEVKKEHDHVWPRRAAPATMCG